MKHVFAAMLCFFSFQSFAQVTISLNSYDEGEYLGIDGYSTMLYASTDTNSSSSWPWVKIKGGMYQPIVFKVLKANTVNGFIKVKVVLAQEEPKIEKGFALKGIDENGQEGWVLASEVKKHPIPDDMALGVYEDNIEMLNIIGQNGEWLKYNNAEEYKLYKASHAQAYFMLGETLFDNGDYQASVVAFSKSIAVLKRKAVYIARAECKVRLEDYTGALADCNSAINLIAAPPKYTQYEMSYMTAFDFRYDVIDPYSMRGFVYLKMNNYTASLTDMNRAISANDKSGFNYYIRGYAKINLGQKSSACLDWSKAGELGFEQAYQSIRDLCN